MAKQTPSEINIKKIVIENQRSGNKLQIIPAPTSEGDDKVMDEIFVSMQINENIMRNGIVGSLKFKEPNTVGDYFNMTGHEFVKIEMESPEIENSEHTLTFCVNDVRATGNEALDAVSGPSARFGAGWDVEFVSCESYILDWDNLDYMDKDFIGPIAGEEGEEGLVNELAEKYLNPGAVEGFSNAKNPMDIEKTHNWIWLKKNQSMYPWGKDVHPPNLMQLMNNLSENAVTEDLSGVNYLFYADLDGWHFKSIRKMIKDANEKGVLYGGVHGGKNEYKVSMKDDEDETKGNTKIAAIINCSEYDHLNAFKSGAYTAYYERIKPSYEDPYFDYMDFTTSHTHPLSTDWGGREIITYGYHEVNTSGKGEDGKWGDHTVGGRVEQFKLLPDSIDTSIKVENPVNIERKSIRKHDVTGLYGYFDSPYNYHGEKSYDFLGSAALEGKQGKQNDKLWQSMFDQTNLEGEKIKIIQEEIKKPTSDSIKAHLQVVNLKEKFNVYRHSICCDKQSIKPFVFLAVIEDAKKVTGDDRGGIYEYSWREVEIWPSDHVEDNLGTVISPLGSPVKIVKPPEGQGLAGTFRENNPTSESEWTNPAYNLNELMNETVGPNVNVGPGINVADLEFNDYPESYQMMPVGGYFQVPDGADMLVDPCALEDLDENGIMDGPWTMKHHIVQMYRIPNYMLGELNEDGDVVKGTIAPSEEDPLGDPDPTIPKDIYFFDVPNAHDGLCGCLS
jgi:hypothetical protein